MGRELRIKNRVLNIWVKPYKNGRLCPHCMRRGSIVRTLKTPRVWRDLPIFGNSLFLYYCPREINCPTHGRVQENIPWGEPYSRVTYRFEHAMLVYCKIMTQKAAAQILHIPKSTLSALLHRAITRIRKGHRIRGVQRQLYFPVDDNYFSLLQGKMEGVRRTTGI